MASKQAEKKATKSEAEYQDTPRGNDACGNCTMFDGNYGCSAVQGRVSPQGWCTYFKRRAGPMAILGGAA